MAPRVRGLAAAVMLTLPGSLLADEGMWLFSSPPLAKLKAKYGVDLTPQWLEHVQKSSVRFNSGGSGSFVSPDGLVMTNHHVGADDLQKLSTAETNYLRDGFEAKTRAEEIKCKGLELNVLQSIADVTAEVTAAVAPGLAPADAARARQKKVGEIEKAGSDEAKGTRADVVTLYAGGRYHRYTYKKYTDIRLVFAPEKQIAFFGGDPDNFEYPRYDLDVCFFRVYENDQPIKCEHYLKWSPDGAKEGEITFVSGHPGRTSRQLTVAELEFLRDVQVPAVLARLYRLEVVIGSWVERSQANRQKGEDELFGLQNSRKARIGGLAGLQDPKVMARKKYEEGRLREFIANTTDAEVKAAAGAFDAVAAAQKALAGFYKEYGALEGASGFNSSYFGFARALVRAAAERPKPSGDRLREYADARLPVLQLQLFSDEPHYDDFETLKLADSLGGLMTALGPDHEAVRLALAGKSPRERAYELVSGTKLKDPAVRKALYEGGQSAVDAAADPMLELAKALDPLARAVRKRYEAEVEEPKRQAYAALAKARFAMDGENTYPDATFTLRLAYGTVSGFTDGGTAVPAFTTLAGLYDRSKAQGNVGPFELPKRWADKKAELDLTTPFNFVSTADIIGGNSGSPVVNAKGEVVGLIFDGNIQSLVLDYQYEQDQARAVSVDSRAIVHALRRVYAAGWLADELQGRR
jgi:hypothetical protein